MEKIPEEIKKKIESKVSDECILNSQDGMLRQRFAEFGYQLASKELEEAKAEIERLKGLIEKAFEAGEKYNDAKDKPSFTGFLDGYTGIYGFKKFAKENNL